jgi:hypothetical protein
METVVGAMLVALRLKQPSLPETTPTQGALSLGRIRRLATHLTARCPCLAAFVEHTGENLRNVECSPGHPSFTA